MEVWESVFVMNICEGLLQIYLSYTSITISIERDATTGCVPNSVIVYRVEFVFKQKIIAIFVDIIVLKTRMPILDDMIIFWYGIQSYAFVSFLINITAYKINIFRQFNR